MKKGFTLIEVIIIVCIIALLAAIAIPHLLRAKAATHHKHYSERKCACSE